MLVTARALTYVVAADAVRECAYVFAAGSSAAAAAAQGGTTVQRSQVA